MSLVAVARLASEKIAPLVRKMENDGKIDPGIIQMLFENGVCKFSIWQNLTHFNGTEKKNGCNVDLKWKM